MPTYDPNFASPPAPVARVTIKNPSANKSVNGSYSRERTVTRASEVVALA
jgi:hypothetical protein